MIWQHFKAQLEEKWNEASRLTSSSLMEMKSSGCCLDRRVSMSCAVVLSLASTSTREPALGSAFSGVSADGGRLLCAHLLFLGATCERHLLFLKHGIIREHLSEIPFTSEGALRGPACDTITSSASAKD